MGEEMIQTDVEDVEDAQASSAEQQEGAQGEHNEESQVQLEKKYTDEDLDRIIAKKIAAERKRIQKIFNEEQQESEIERRERDVLKRELTADAKAMLLKDNLPAGLSDIMNYNSKEELEQSYQVITTVFQDAVNQTVKRFFASAPPKVSTKICNDPITDAFAPKVR